MKKKFLYTFISQLNTHILYKDTCEFFLKFFPKFFQFIFFSTQKSRRALFLHKNCLIPSNF